MEGRTYLGFDLTIIPLKYMGSSRTGTIKKLDLEQISQILGFYPNEYDMDKTPYQWAFRLNGVRCSIWSYRDSHLLKLHSTCGPYNLLKMIFGDHYEGRV
jgi:hypothetical protein